MEADKEGGAAGMSRREKLKFYATAPRASAAQITKIVDGQFVNYWAPRLRSKFVRLKKGRFLFENRLAAVEEARRFRASCRMDAIHEGLLSQ